MEEIRSSGNEVSARELVGGGGEEYCTVYTGTTGALINAGIATAEQFPQSANGTKSGGFAGYKRNPDQRWKVRRRARDLFDVYRWHEPRRIEPAFQRFMLWALQPA